MEFGKLKFDRRLAVISIMAVLIGLVIALSVTCIWLFEFAHERNKPNPVSQKTEATADPEKDEEPDYSDIGKIITEIENMFRSKYVRERGEDYRAEVINAYLEGTGDPYAYYYTPEEMQKDNEENQGHSYGIGITVAWTDKSLMIVHVMQDSPANRGGLRSGDELLSVNGVSFDGLTYNEALKNCRGEKGDEKNFTLLRDGKTLEIKITCDDYTIESVFSRIEVRNGVKIGVIECDQFINPTPNEMKTAVEYVVAEGAKGIVFDMRGNPGGLLDSVVRTLDYLLPEGPVVHIRYKNSDFNEDYTSDADYATDLPMVILVNSSTASAGELFTSCMRDFDRATIIGETTFGKGCGQTQYPLSDGGYIKFTTFFYDPPKSENYDGVGIVPDIAVELPEEYASKNISLIPEGQDAQLEAALEYLAK